MDQEDKIIRNKYILNNAKTEIWGFQQVTIEEAGLVGQWRTQEFCSEGGGSTNSVEDRGQRERGSGGGSPLVRGSGGSCSLVKEIHFI